jgi:hypothetical protein
MGYRSMDPCVDQVHKSAYTGTWLVSWLEHYAGPRPFGFYLWCHAHWRHGLHLVSAIASRCPVTPEPNLQAVWDISCTALRIFFSLP